MQIRPMKLEDIEQVVAMENKTWDNFNTPASLPAANKHKIIQTFQNHSHYLVAEENGVILGVLDYHAYYPFPSARHVVSFIIAVDKDTQGQGIGHSLIQAFFTVAKSDNYKKVVIHVLSSNKNACRFYENIGFTLEATLKNQFYLNGTYVDDLIYSYYLEEIHAK
ncbi:GNAT family acetyltransferase [Streptococcus equinus]|uniref:GNAT family N-acetyltransferase n=1 Tax=Streptococcus equinus TaxID=1335 RepID=UPI000F6D08A7|nr:GNAT family N-acetyltransferase [Streptococcus equinus]VED90593.1 GNAT family acetyltransferase [Streptococcus equinus]VTS81198.1 GNAT family acetyltransferase [Streptococcus equinus]